MTLSKHLKFANKSAKIKGIVYRDEYLFLGL
jgi:hypothetical protein